MALLVSNLDSPRTLMPLRFGAKRGILAASFGVHYREPATAKVHSDGVAAHHPV